MVKGFYAVLSWIDYLVYSLVSSLLSVNIDIAGKEIFTPEQITNIANRIYIVVGVLMLFKVVISAIQFMVNPDSFDDKEKGAVGLLKKTAICFAMIVFAPAVFNFMIAMQTTIIDAVPRVIFGSESEESDSQSETEKMAFTVLSAFIEENKEGKNPGKGSIGEGKTIHDLKSFKEHASDGCPEWFDFDVSKCYYNYMIIISTAAGIFLCYVLLSMTLDVAIRTIKFSLIRILAPIPISSYIFSKDKLNKFVKTTLTVYCDLFIRLAVIYFIIFAVKEVITSGMLKEVAGDKGWFYNALVNIAIIGGLFMFAKNAPKFITELLGLPDIGAGDMKDMFKPGWQRYGGLAGAAINPMRTMAGNMLTSWQQSRNLRGKDSWWKTTRRIGRMMGAGARGLAEGTVDATKGLAAGDDWSKMRQRMKDRDTASFKKAYRANYFRTVSRKDAANQKLGQIGINTLSFIGQTPVDSKGYSDASSAISSLRSEAFTGRAKGEVDKAPDMFARIRQSAGTLANGDLILNPNHEYLDSNGNPIYTDANGNALSKGRTIQTTFSVTDAAGHKFKDVDYGKLHELQVKIQNGSATAADYQAVTYTDENGVQTNMHAAGISASVVSDVHERVGKKAYQEYVDIAVAADARYQEMAKVTEEEIAQMPQAQRDKFVADRELLKGLADREVLDRIARFRETIVGLNIPSKEKDAMITSLNDDPGGWLAGANKDAQRFSTIATQRGKMEQAAKKDNKS